MFVVISLCSGSSCCCMCLTATILPIRQGHASGGVCYRRQFQRARAIRLGKGGVLDCPCHVKGEGLGGHGQQAPDASVSTQTTGPDCR